MGSLLRLGSVTRVICYSAKVCLVSLPWETGSADALPSQGAP